jgi:minor curlin subunit
MERKIISDTVRYFEIVKGKLYSFVTLLLVVFSITVSETSHSLEFDQENGLIHIGKWYFPTVTKPKSGKGFGEGITKETVSSYFEIKFDGDLDSVEDISADMFGNDFNHAEIDLNDSISSLALIAQVGDGNYAEIYVDGYRNYALVRQLGYDNLALLAQNGIGNISIVLQYGRNNSALVIQDGNRNYAKVIQGSYWLDNRVSVSQVGEGHKAIVLAGGMTNIGISQLSNDAASMVAVNSKSNRNIQVIQGSN